MTELQPTEIDLSPKRRRPVSLPRKRVVAVIVFLFAVACIAALTGVMAHRASTTPDAIKGATLPSETAEIIISE